MGLSVMSASPFDSPRRKMQRACDLIAELEQLLVSYDGAYLVPTPISPTMGALVLRILTPPPPKIQEIMGDAIHNLRASLDHLAVAVVGLNDKSPRGVYFPFCENVDDLEVMIKRRNFHRASPEALDLLRSLKPYPGGNDALRGLHDLDNLDKHNKLIAVLHMVNITHLKVGNLTIENGLIGAPDGARLIVMPRFAIEADAPKPIRLGLAATFGGGPFNQGPIVPTLKGLANLCFGIGEAFEALYRR